MVHKPKHRVHSFRGLLADGGEDEINLERQNVNLAYRVVKLAIIPNDPGGTNPESVVMVWREKQTNVVDTVDFTNTDLLGVAYWSAPAVGAVVIDTEVIFDNILFSRNIYITHKDHNASVDCNYYIEIEEVPVTAATLMQLKLGVARKLNLEMKPTP